MAKGNTKNKVKKKKKHAGGRPPRMIKDTLEKLELAFKAGLNDEEASIYAKIDPSTLYKYQKKHKEFTEQKEAWKKNPVLKAKLTVYNSLSDPKTAQWYLERKAKAEFGTRLTLTGGEEGEGGPVSITLDIGGRDGKPAKS